MVECQGAKAKDCGDGCDDCPKQKGDACGCQGAAMVECQGAKAKDCGDKAGACGDCPGAKAAAEATAAEATKAVDARPRALRVIRRILTEEPAGSR
jgi:hypothetical protein